MRTSTLMIAVAFVVAVFAGSFGMQPDKGWHAILVSALVSAIVAIGIALFIKKSDGAPRQESFGDACGDPGYTSGESDQGQL